MALTHPSSGEVLTYSQARQLKIDLRVAKRPRTENFDSVDVQDFKKLDKGNNTFKISLSAPGKEFMQLNLPSKAPVVCSPYKPSLNPKFF
jgi:hypothetical protein